MVWLYSCVGSYYYLLLLFLNLVPNQDNRVTPGQQALGRFTLHHKRERRSLVKPSHCTHALNNPFVFAQKFLHFGQTKVICSRFQESLIWRSNAREYR